MTNRRNRPNILVILTDQHAADALSCADNPYIATPHLDRLAARGVRFTRNYVSSPVCVPWRTSFIFGHMPHQVVHPGTEEDMTGGRNTTEPRGVLPEFQGRDLGSLVADAGYDCAYAGKWHVGQWGPTESLPDGDHAYGFRKLCGIHDPETTARSIDFLREERDRPFLLVASFDNPHNICEWRTGSALPWGNLPEPPALPDLPPLPANFPESPDEPLVVREERAKFAQRYAYSPEDWRRYRWAYFRLVEKVDDAIGKILDALDETGLADSTLVLFTSDHGELHGAHGLANKHLFYEESARSPMIAAGAGVANPGTTDDHLVCNALDFHATILDAAGAGPNGPGRSLIPILRDQPHRPWRDHLIASCRFNLMPGQGRMVRTERHKYILYERGPRQEQLFDLETDPGEMVNLADIAAHADTLQQHRELLRIWMEETGDTWGSAHYAHPDAGIMLPGDDFNG